MFLFVFAYSTDSILCYAYRPLATASSAEHSLSAAASAVHSVIATAAQATAGRIDILSRAELKNTRPQHRVIRKARKRHSTRLQWIGSSLRWYLEPAAARSS